METVVFPWIDALPLPEAAKGLIKVAFVVGLGSVILQFIGWMWDRAKETRERTERAKQDQIDAHNSSFRDLNLAYERFLLELLRYPHLGVLPIQPDNTDLSSDDRMRRAIFYDLVACMGERAWLDRDLTEDIRQHQWPGWDAFLRAYMSKPTFRAHWLTPGGGNFDSRFETYMDGLLAEAAAKAG